MEKMTKKAFVGLVADALGVSKAQADTVLGSVGSVVAAQLKQGVSVPLPGLGVLRARIKLAHTARNPATGKPVKVPEKIAVSFSACSELKAEL